MRIKGELRDNYLVLVSVAHICKASRLHKQSVSI